MRLNNAVIFMAILAFSINSVAASDMCEERITELEMDLEHSLAEAESQEEQEEITDEYEMMINQVEEECGAQDDSSDTVEEVRDDIDHEDHQASTSLSFEERKEEVLESLNESGDYLYEEMHEECGELGRSPEEYMERVENAEDERELEEVMGQMDEVGLAVQDCIRQLGDHEDSDQPSFEEAVEDDISDQDSPNHEEVTPEDLEDIEKSFTGLKEELERKNERIEDLEQRVEELENQLQGTSQETDEQQESIEDSLEKQSSTGTDEEVDDRNQSSEQDGLDAEPTENRSQAEGLARNLANRLF